MQATLRVRLGQLYIQSLLPLIKYHKEHDTEYFDAYLAAEYARGVKQRYVDGEIKREHYYHRMRGLDKITRLHDTGKLLWEHVRKGSMYESNEYYECLLGEYLGSEEFNQNTRGDIVWVA